LAGSDLRLRLAVWGFTLIELRLRLPVISLLLLLIAAILLPSRVWNTLLVGLGGLLLIAYIWARQLARHLAGRRRLRFGWVAVGDRLSEEFEVENNSYLPALWVEVIDHSNVPGYQPAIVRSVAGDDTDRWRQSAVCIRRGQFSLGPWAIRASDPFGIFHVTHHYPVSGEIIIHPPIHSQLPIPLPAGHSSGRSRARERSWQATINAASVRDYHPQDPLRWIHWPTTARRGELFVRQFDLDAAGDVWLLVDMEAAAQLGEGPLGTEEQAVLLAASLSAQAMSQGRPVGFAAYGQTPQLVAPGRGEGQQWKILRALALCRADGQAGLSDALRDLGRNAARGAAAMIITSSGQADWAPELLRLSHHGVRVSVILLDRPSFGGQGNSAGLADGLRELGFTVFLVRQGEIGRPPAEEERRGYWEFKVLASGKVVTVRDPTLRR
jgi:uncharacterized protein (DUF58 family)